ncbi:hypothetical protein LCGC14_0353180 [marine sediment metagenome]|uniref:RmlD-like substrate binding domain-containing protein n=1 Tax=marine sediment metagenome TaxID=412755 RepID=A0A0F9VX96_9ZZZZ
MIYQDTDVVVTGARGMLGRAVVKALDASDYYRVLPYPSYAMDISDTTDIMNLTGANVINCAGIVRGRDDVSAKRMGEVNALAPYRIAAVARRLIQVSTDCVFDGTKGPYVESDEPTPSDHYGYSKLMGEIDYAPHLTVRTSFIGFGQRGLLRWLLDQPQGATVPGFRRWLWNGLYVDTVARQLVRLLDDPITGILHIEGPVISKYELLEMIAKAIRPDITVSAAIYPNILDKNMILKSERYDWTIWNFGWIDVIEELKTDYEVEKANQMLASGGDPEGAPGIGI